MTLATDGTVVVRTRQQSRRREGMTTYKTTGRRESTTTIVTKVIPSGLGSFALDFTVMAPRDAECGFIGTAAADADFSPG